MKRKIIKQGHNTLTITLPNEWAKRFNLKPGDELNITEKEDCLSISAQKNEEISRAEIDISEMDIPTIWKYFMAVYREGYDEVKVIFKPWDVYESPYKFIAAQAVDIKYEKNPIQRTSVETIQDLTSRFIGFEVMEHHKNYCIIRDMGDISTKEFDSSFRRVFLLLLQMGEEIVETIKNNNTETVQHTHDIDINVDKFHDYCVRVLNKTGFKNVKKGHLMFSTLYLLEMLGDELKTIAHHLLEDIKDKKMNNLYEIAEMTLQQIRNYYDIFYNFNKSKVIEMSKQDMEIHFYLPKLYKKGTKKRLSDDELEIINHFRRITNIINALIELRVEMDF
jgi:phosphate uptake regulator